MKDKYFKISGDTREKSSELCNITEAEKRFYFQQGNDPTHRAKATQ